MTYYILIVGAGQLGSRHLQSVKQTKLKTRIMVYDVSVESLNMAKERYEQIPENKHIESIEFVTSLSRVNGDIDFAIIATSSIGRAAIISSVLDVCNVKFMLIEKVLFQNLSDYHVIQTLLNSRKVKAWVNCPRRMNTFYRELSTSLTGQNLSVTFEGYRWGMGCNSIHYIDLMSFLCHCDEYVIVEKLDKQVLDSKRKGYSEFTGEIFLTFRNKSQCRIISHNEDSQGLILTIVSEDYRIVIDEGKGEVFISSRANGWNWANEKFKLRYQSELTSIVYEDLIAQSDCELTPYSESARLHQPFISMLLKFLNTNCQNGIDNCPIT